MTFNHNSDYFRGFKRTRQFIDDDDHNVPKNYYRRAAAPVDDPGHEVKQQFELLLVRLNSTDLEEVISTIGSLDGLITYSFSRECLYHSCAPFLRDNVDRIVQLCASQYVYILTVYLKANPSVNPNVMDRVEKLLDFSTRLLHNLLLKYAVQLGAAVTCAALVKLMHNILPYLSSPTICYTNANHRGHVHLGQVHLLVSDILASSTRDYTQKTGLASVRVLLKAILLRLLRELAVSDSANNTKFEPLIDELNHLIKLYLNDVHRLNHVDINKHMKLVVYEIYRFIEFSSQMVTFPTKPNLRALKSAKSYICSIFAQLGPEAAWKHFSLVDQELTAAKRNPQEVALFKYLATHGYTRLVPGNHKMVNPKSSVDVQKDIEKPVSGTVDSKGEYVEPQLELEDPVESKAPSTSTTTIGKRNIGTSQRRTS